jgi:uncharacterized protein YqhQ
LGDKNVTKINKQQQIAVVICLLSFQFAAILFNILKVFLTLMIQKCKTF